MSFNEKTAWSACSGIVAGLVVYFWLVAAQPSEGGHLPMPSLTTLIVSTIVSVLTVVVPLIVLSAFAPKEAGVTVDERDEIIIGQAGFTGSFALQVLLIVPLYLLFTGAPAATVFHALILASCVSGLIDYGGQIWRYHRAI